MNNKNDHTLKAKDFATEQDVRWCPGCGDYSILKQVQSVLADFGTKAEDTVFVSGIGCSSRFPYYMNTYGVHSIHGRAPALASGIKCSKPGLKVWVITGDGDGLSIGGNHIIHMMRKNFDVNVLLFNNEIYGLTKGQYSPTSPKGIISKSTPFGSIDHPFNPLALCLGADASFVARSMDRDPRHLRAVLSEADKHKGTAFVEIYQNCNVFNDGAFALYTEKQTKTDTTLFLKHDQPLTFGEGESYGIVLDGFTPKVVSMADNSKNDLWIHDESDRIKASILTRFFTDSVNKQTTIPRPFGVFYREQRETYEDQISNQIEEAISKNGAGDLDELLEGNDSWEIK